jgi:hypothetical protein
VTDAPSPGADVTRGPAGYGRYDDDPKHVGCPRAKSDMTPCIARDGHLALAGDPPSDCAGCGQEPGVLLTELAAVYGVPGAPRAVDPGRAADRLRMLVREATEPATEAT